MGEVEIYKGELKRELRTVTAATITTPLLPALSLLLPKLTQFLRTSPPAAPVQVVTLFLGKFLVTKLL